MISDASPMLSTLYIGQLPDQVSQADDIAAAVAWLASNEARHVTGIQPPVDWAVQAHPVHEGAQQQPAEHQLLGHRREDDGHHHQHHDRDDAAVAAREVGRLRWRRAPGEHQGQDADHGATEEGKADAGDSRQPVRPAHPVQAEGLPPAATPCRERPAEGQQHREQHQLDADGERGDPDRAGRCPGRAGHPRGSPDLRSAPPGRPAVRASCARPRTAERSAGRCGSARGARSARSTTGARGDPRPRQRSGPPRTRAARGWSSASRYRAER